MGFGEGVKVDEILELQVRAVRAAKLAGVHPVVEHAERTSFIVRKTNKIGVVVHSAQLFLEVSRVESENATVHLEVRNAPAARTDKDHAIVGLTVGHQYSVHTKSRQLTVVVSV